MTAARLNLIIEAGATFERTLEWQDPAGVPVDLTGYTARMQVRPAGGSDEPVVDLSSPDEITLGGADGRITIVIPADTTADLPAGLLGPWDLLLTSASRAVRLVSGVVTVTAAVTR